MPINKNLHFANNR